MLTIFSTLKPLSVPYADNVQRNAIQSWMALSTPCEILLLGDDEGTAEIAAEYGLRHEPNIAYLNSASPPLANSVFARGQELASFDLVMYINADVILLSDFIPTLKSIVEQRKNSSKPYLVVGQRHDLELRERLDFQNPHWEYRLRMEVKRCGFLRMNTFVDYFIFKKSDWLKEMPAFTVGADCYDNWLIYRARSIGMDVIDATQGITAIQQEQENRDSKAFSFKRREGPMGRRQYSLMKDKRMLFSIRYANLRYTLSGLQRRSPRVWAKALMDNENILHPRLAVLLQILDKINARLLKMKNELCQITREPLTRKRLKRILYKSGPRKYPQFKALFCIGQCLHRQLKTRFGLSRSRFTSAQKRPPSP